MEISALGGTDLMKLKNFLIVVKDIEKARQFYHDLFGLEMLTDNDGNLIEVGTPMEYLV
jgi:catechol 2,3-dioxygenase-like lactoylglutathione lyase family enzyme